MDGGSGQKAGRVELSCVLYLAIGMHMGDKVGGRGGNSAKDYRGKLTTTRRRGHLALRW